MKQFRTERRTLWSLALWALAASAVLTMAASALEGASAEAAAPPSKEQQALLGVYYGGGEALLIRENEGRLELLYRYLQDDRDFAKAVVYPLHKVRFDSYTLVQAGPLFTGEAAVRFERDNEGRGASLSLAKERYSRYFMPGDKAEERLPATPDAAQLAADAAAATMPAKLAQGTAVTLVDLVSQVPNLKLKYVYATPENLFGQPLYSAEKALAAPVVAQALAKAAPVLAAHGYGLLCYEAYRPWHISKLAWDLLPADQKDMLPTPQQGSVHNTGLAVDVGLYDLETCEELSQISYFDEPSPRQYGHFAGGSSQQRAWRDMLRDALTDAGLTASDMEWWHFEADGADKAAHLNTPL